MKNLLEFIKNIRTNLKDPKKKALTRLGIYFMFFAIVFIMLNAKGSVKLDPINVPEVPTKVLNYEYVYTINNNVIYGTHYETRDSLLFNNTYYKLIDGNYYNVLDNSLLVYDFDLTLFSYDNILNIIENNELLDSTKYDDNTIKEIYNIKTNNFIKESLENGILTIYKKDYIYEVKFNINNTNIKIEYKNINKIKDNISE